MCRTGDATRVRPASRSFAAWMFRDESCFPRGPPRERSGDVEPELLVAELDDVAGLQLDGLLRAQPQEHAARRGVQIDQRRRPVGRDAHFGMPRREQRVGGEIEIAPGAANGDGRTGTEANAAGLPSAEDLGEAYRGALRPRRAEVRRVAAVADRQLARSVEP